jgi:hypothetical protein
LKASWIFMFPTNYPENNMKKLTIIFVSILIPIRPRLKRMII